MSLIVTQYKVQEKTAKRTLDSDKRKKSSVAPKKKVRFSKFVTQFTYKKGEEKTIPLRNNYEEHIRNDKKLSQLVEQYSRINENGENETSCSLFHNREFKALARPRITDISISSCTTNNKHQVDIIYLDDSQREQNGVKYRY